MNSECKGDSLINVDLFMKVVLPIKVDCFVKMFSRIKMYSITKCIRFNTWTYKFVIYLFTKRKPTIFLWYMSFLYSHTSLSYKLCFQRANYVHLSSNLPFKLKNLPETKSLEQKVIIIRKVRLQISDDKYLPLHPSNPPLIYSRHLTITKSQFRVEKS